MRTIRVGALAAFLFPFVATGSALAAQDDHLILTAPLYCEPIRDAQHARSRSDLRVTSQPVWTTHPDKTELKNESTATSGRRGLGWDCTLWNDWRSRSTGR